MGSKHNLTDQEKAFIQEYFKKRKPAWIARKINVPLELVEDYIAQQESRASNLSTGRQRLFRLLMFLFPILFFLLLELSLRLIGYGPNLKLFIPLKLDSRYLITNPDLGLRYFPISGVKPRVSLDAFLKEKPSGTFRIFVLGGSTAAGYPYLYNGSFSAILKVIFQELYPDKSIEIINCAMPAVNSYTVRDIARELPQYQPDLIIIYAGHNEFYGALGVGSAEYLGTSRWLVNTFIRLRQYKIFQLTSDIIRLLKKGLQKITGKEIKPSGTLMERMVRKKIISYGSPLYWAAHRIFKENMADVIREFKKRHVPLIISTVVSNVHHLPPFENVFISPQSRKRWESEFKKAGALYNSGNFDEALKAIQSCIEIDSLPASQYFLKAQIEEQSGDTLSAYKDFYRAKDFDALRFRASEELNEELKALARTYNVPVVDIKAVFEQHSLHHIPGKELLLEHLHPNLRGYSLMAIAFAKKIFDMGLLKRPANIDWNEQRWKDKILVTKVDSIVARLRIKYLVSKWPFKKSETSGPSSFQFKPRNPIEKLAFRFWLNQITWEKMHVEAAQYYFRNRNYARTEREYKALILQTPMNPSPYELLAKLYIQLKDYSRAKVVLQKLIRIYPSHFAYKMLGSIFINQHHIDEGIRYLRKAVELQPSDPQALYNLSVGLVNSGQFSEAWLYVQRLMTIQANYPGARKLYQYVKGRLSEEDGGKN